VTGGSGSGKGGSGGTNSSGGSTASGGGSGNGGTTGSGGTNSGGSKGGGGGTGGTSATGGSSTGGSSTSGTSASGGKTTTGGASASGGSGGASSGGKATGGSAAGGSAAGGSATGGKPAPGKKFVGNITTSGAVRSDFATYWDQITPENEGKWGSVEATRGTMNWAGLDAIHDYAKAHNIVFKQHNFVWGQQQPSWISGLSASEQAAEVEEWIRLFCERYPDVALMDVVNEPPPHTTPPYMAALGGAGTTGFDWIVTAFKWARKYCPNSILILNDYNILRWGDSNIIAIANAIKSTGYLDALGSQSHGQETEALSELQSRLTTLIAVGLPIYITEYDVSIDDDAQQLKVYQDQFTLFWNTPQIKGITMWGYVYGSTWSQAPYSGLIKNGTPRPALTWLMNLVGR
jgi:endo-1,4-beta-xylanase